MIDGSTGFAGHDTQLAQLRAQHGTHWDYIGKRAGEIGWWASRETSPGITHHIVCRTLPELDRELSATPSRQRLNTPPAQRPQRHHTTSPPM